MQIASDTQTSFTPNPDDLGFVRDFLAVSTFLKPNFRIAVARTGELKVQVELTTKDLEPRN